MKTMKT
jgi:hypothetical protein